MDNGKTQMFNIILKWFFLNYIQIWTKNINLCFLKTLLKMQILESLELNG